MPPFSYKLKVIMDSLKNIFKYIQKEWPKCTRKIPNDTDEVIGLPYPYAVPCIKDDLQFLFYWDTYFTNIGLILLKEYELAKNNTDNLLYIVEKLGFVPNSNAQFMLNRSQLPFLSLMVKDVYQIYEDKQWLRQAISTLEKEYNFWMHNRITPLGLNRNGHSADQNYLLDFYNNELEPRLHFGLKSDAEKIHKAGHLLAEAETGWDFTPRFDHQCLDYIPVDLNSLLYSLEKNLGEFNAILGLDSQKWLEKAELRKTLMDQYCWNAKEGLFLDYHYGQNKHTTTPSLATFFPLFAGLADEKQAKAIVENMSLFEYDYGMTTCKAGNRERIYQWDHPNGWPPLQFVVIKGLENYDYNEQANRIAEKYLHVVQKNWEQTGSLWEKYNVVEGSIQVNDEYKMPPMMGWSSGVFLYCLNKLTV